MAYIYALLKKGSQEIRYVGQTVSPSHRRLANHKQEAKRGESGYKNNWIRSIGPNMLEMRILEVVEDGNRELLNFRECFWIAALREAGYNLVNRTDGGSTGFSEGWVHSEEQKQKWSRDRKGSITGDKNPNWGKTGPAHPAYGRKLSDETKKRLSDQKKGENNPNYGKVYTPEERLAKSLETKGVPRPKSARSAHTRYHTNKGIRKPEVCRYCSEN